MSLSTLPRPRCMALRRGYNLIMAQPMRTGEVNRLIKEARRFATNQPEDTALLALMTELLSDAGEGRPRVAMASAALRATIEAIWAQGPPSLPAAERRTWERAGARFDTDAIPLTEAASAAAFASLVERSLVGDAAVAERLGVDRSRISQRVGDRSLYPFTGPTEERCFPGWQFAGAKTVPGLKVVLSSVDDELHPLTVDHWFTTPHVDLEVDGEPVTPIGWLTTGGSPKVAAELARDL